MIDIVPGYLFCGIKLLTKCTESLIANVHKIPIYAPAIHHPSASAAPTASGVVWCLRGESSEARQPQPSASHFQDPSMLQTDGGWRCGSGTWVKVRASSPKQFTEGYREQALESHKYLNDCLQSFGLVNARRQENLGWRVGFLCLPQRLCDGRESSRDLIWPPSPGTLMNPPSRPSTIPHIFLPYVQFSL